LLLTWRTFAFASILVFPHHLFSTDEPIQNRVSGHYATLMFCPRMLRPLKNADDGEFLHHLSLFPIIFTVQPFSPLSAIFQ